MCARVCVCVCVGVCVCAREKGREGEIDKVAESVIPTKLYEARHFRILHVQMTSLTQHAHAHARTHTHAHTHTHTRI